MFALAIDGEYKGQVEAIQVKRILADREIEAKIEVASFSPGEGWIPVCLDKFVQVSRA